MIKNLVIVESPAKAKTIEKFLGKDFKVMSSYGHIRDLAKRNFSIDLESDFSPVYEIPDDKKDLVKNLRKAAKEAETIWLASDEDREGEAIAWHLSEVLGLDPDTTKRIVFHEITKDAILHAIANPRVIDRDRVDAQQARRVLDRIVGFELSPVLWRKIKPSLSAGRVQSVAVRLIVERENEIKNFVPEPYFRVNVNLTNADNQPVKADFAQRIDNEQSARELLNDCKDTVFTVADVAVKPMRKSPAPPFTTSTLQQEAARKLGFTVSQTMRVAQSLYESGHITYMRTDSVNLSSLAKSAIAKHIKATSGEKYLQPRNFHTHSKGAQEAHEAIRPTHIENLTISGTAQENRLYQLIWKRAVASQMADAEIEKTTVDITPASRPNDKFTASGEVIKFDGFLSVYFESSDNANEGADDNASLPALKPGESLQLLSMVATERFTQAPPRYTEASLVKKMEELGIGRPSTYAPTISTIQQREYVEKGERTGTPREFVTLTLKGDKITSKKRTENVGADKGKLIPTDTGVIVNDFLTQYFPDILDYNFTASIEERFDDIAEGQLPWVDEIRKFYSVFHPSVEGAMNLRMEHKVGERLLGTDPTSGKPVSVKIGRYGPLVQIGDGESDEKPLFASLQKGQSMADITLEEALKLFEFPRNLGQFEGKDVVVAIGRFGPYVRHDGKFVSIPKTIAPAAISLEEAQELITAKREAESKRVVKSFDADPDMMILNGRYGVYIAYKGSNYKIPKSVDNPADLSLEQCLDIVKAQASAPKKSSRAAKAKKS